MADPSYTGPRAPVLCFTKLTSQARAPVKGSEYAAGFDLFSAEAVVIQPGGRACIRMDLQLAIPPGCYGRVAPRSGLALKHGIDVGAGVVDANYRGNVAVLLFNFGSAEFSVALGDRVAQLILERICYAELVEVSALDQTPRGSSGFGSSGLN